MPRVARQNQAQCIVTMYRFDTSRRYVSARRCTSPRLNRYATCEAGICRAGHWMRDNNLVSTHGRSPAGGGMVSDRPSEWSHFGPGSRIGKYVLEQQIGHGGMAVVFRAREDQLG